MQLRTQTVFLAFILVFILAGIFSYRAGILDDVIGYSTGYLSGRDVFTSDNEITDIRIINTTEKDATISTDYFFNGIASDTVQIKIELIPKDIKLDTGIYKQAVEEKSGTGTVTATINRPRHEVEGFGIDGIRVRMLTKSGELLTQQSKDLELIWPSLVDEAKEHSLQYWKSHAEMAFRHGWFHSLDRMFEQWNDPSLRTKDGKWRLDALDNFLVKSRYMDWDKMYELVKKWKAVNPHSEGAAIAEAMYWRKYAWNARGNGYANTVTETGWELFKERLQKAEQALITSRDYAANNPLWGMEYIRLSSALAWKPAERLELFNKVVKREPYYYLSYFHAAQSVSPRWGGSYKLMDYVARTAADLTEEHDGEIAYSRVYWSIAGGMSPGKDFFEDTLVSWPLMRKGFEQLMAAYPESNWNLNNFAAFACRAGDMTTFLTLRKQIGDDRQDERAWRNNYTMGSCDKLLLTES